MPTNATTSGKSSGLTRSGRSFVARRKARSAGRSTAPIYHAVTPGCRMALCADEPGAGSGWAEPAAEHVTCTICLRRLARLGA